MAFETNNPYLSRAQAAQAALDLGLRTHMLRVYNYMASALALTGIVALVVASQPELMRAIFSGGMIWLFLIAELGLVFYFSARIQALSYGAAQAIFWSYAALNGVTLSILLLAYTGASVARVFFITAATFAATSLYGYTTRRDLTGFGSFLFMGLIGLMIASVVNIFLKSSGLYFVISWVGVLVFTGLTAWDTQRIKEMYVSYDDDASMGKKALMGALALYLDFINLFIMMLRIMGDRR